MRRNRLYTVNKWNRPAFMPDMNLFGWGGIAGSNFNVGQGLSGDALAGLQNANSQQALFNAFNLGKGMSSSGGSGFNFGSLFGGQGGSSGSGSGGIGGGSGAGWAAAGQAAMSAGMEAMGKVGVSEDFKRGLWDRADPVHYLAGGKESEVGNALGDMGVNVTKSSLQSGNWQGALVGAGLKIIGGLTNAAFGLKADKDKKEAADQSISANRNFMSNANSFDDIKGPSAAVNTDVYEGGWFSGGKADDKNKEMAENMRAAYSWADRSMQNNVNNLISDQLSDNLRNYSAYGGPLDFGGGALGLMQQNRYFDTTDKRSEAIAGKNGLNTAYIGGAKTFDFGGLKSSFLDEFGSDPIGAAVRYNQRLEAMAAQEEAKQIEAAKEQEYLGLQQRLADLETQNQGLQALMAAQTTPAVPESTTPSSPSTPSRATSNGSTWDYIEDQLRKSGKFNDVQIEGIKYNLQRESSLDPTAVGDGGSAFGLGQWHGDRKPSDMSLEGQTQHLIDTLSNYDGRLHWIGRDNYEGFLNARTPEEAHYWITRGYERPRKDIVDKVKRYSDMSLRRLNAFGGELGTNGTDWTNGLLYIDEGGSHESNPLDGVPMGLDPQGIPNLVEEGETVYNDYVFSDRMQVPGFMYKELGLGGTIKKKSKGMSFADASKKLALESEQRPNDPISQDGLEASLSRLAEVQEAERMRQQAEEYMGLEGYACGGKIGRKFGGTGSQSQKMPKGVSVGETYNPWWPLGVDFNEWTEDARKGPMFDAPWGTGLKGTVDIEYPEYKPATKAASASGSRAAKVESRKGTATSGRGVSSNRNSDNPYGSYIFDSEKAAEEVAKERGTSASQLVIDEAAKQRIAMDGYTPRTTAEEIATINAESSPYRGLHGYTANNYPTWMRYAPVAGLGLMSITDALGLTNKPDYTYADKLEAMANGAAYAPDIQYKPVGDYMRYTPLDRQYYLNQLMANSRATDRALMNVSSPSRAAGLLANGYNTTLSIGNLARQAEEYNRAQYERTKEFNRKTNMFNSQMDLEAAMANARYRQAAQQMGLSGLAQAAALREQIDARTSAAKSANLSNFLTSLGNIGRENFAMNQINNDRSRNYLGNLSGGSGYKRSDAKGGKINRRK